MNIETLAAKYSAIPSHWKVSTLGESLAAIVGGGTPSRDNPSFWGGEIPWLTVKDMRGRRPTDAQEHITQQAVKESATNIIPPDTVITATRVGLGKVVRVPYAAAINQDLKALVVGPDLDRSYLEYWLLSIATFLESIGSGTTVKGIRLETLRQLPIPLAPLHEQRNIVAEIEKQFSRLDEAVANLQRVKANLKRYKASVLKAAVEGRLVQTEAALARREGRTFETGEQLLQRILEERRAKWVGRGKYKEPVTPAASGLSGLPLGWAIATYAQLGVVTTGFTPPTGDAANFGGRIPFFKPTDLDAGDNVCLAREYLSDAGLQKGRKLPAGSVLVTCIGATIGKTGLACVDCATNQQINSVSPVNDCVDSRYLFWWTCSPAGQAQIVDNASATTLPILNKSKFEVLPVVLPPAAEQTRIVAEVDRHLSIIREVEAEVDVNLQRAQALRQATLAKAFGVQH